MNNMVEEFKKNKYVLVKDAVDKKIVNLISQYALIDEKNDFTLEEGKHPQIHNSHSQYSDTLMESVLLQMHPYIEEVTGLTLYPTYSYYRVYRPGAVLVKHKDRPSCEISATVTLNFNFCGENYSYPIFVDGTECVMQPGDLVVYRGCEVDHWREEFKAPTGSYQVQVFLHYVDANGPYADFKFDRRPFIGYNKEAILDKVIAKTFLPFKEYIIFSP
jgi:hypothetical protein